MRMMIYQREPVFTIGQAPFVAGAIHVRSQIRVLKQREKARRQKAFVERISSLRGTLPRYLSTRRMPRLEWSEWSEQSDSCRMTRVRS
jgi:hypothetical protein